MMHGTHSVRLRLVGVARFNSEWPRILNKQFIIYLRQFYT
jgi:hypothetical protein